MSLHRGLYLVFRTALFASLKYFANARNLKTGQGQSQASKLPYKAPTPRRRTGIQVR